MLHKTTTAMQHYYKLIHNFIINGYLEFPDISTSKFTCVEPSSTKLLVSFMLFLLIIFQNNEGPQLVQSLLAQAMSCSQNLNIFYFVRNIWFSMRCLIYNRYTNIIGFIICTLDNLRKLKELFPHIR